MTKSLSKKTLLSREISVAEQDVRWRPKNAGGMLSVETMRRSQKLKFAAPGRGSSTDSKHDVNIRTLAGRMITRLAREMGAQALIEPRWGAVGQITFKNGVRRYFRGSTIDINTVGAAGIAKDKDYAAFFMRKMGYPVLTGKAFFSDEWAHTIGSQNTTSKALAYAERIGYPVIVKPNSRSQGKGVMLARNRQDAERALRDIFTYETVALVQAFVAGNDYRIVVLDGAVISAYQRLPFSITGDGRSAIRSLIETKIRAYKTAGRTVSLSPHDPRIVQTLKSKHLTLRSVIRTGKTITLLSNANLSTGGDAVDVTEDVHPAWRTLAVRLSKDMGLRLSGIDVISKSLLSMPPKKYWVLEINASPGLDHYAHSGRTQERLVENMYRRILKAIQRR